MAGNPIKIRSSVDEGEFDCYLSLPQESERAPAVVLAAAVHGVDKDICDLCDEFAKQGYIAIAPDLFWRWLPGPIAGGDSRAGERSRPRPEKIAANEADMRDTLTYIRTLPQFNGRAAAIGFCYGSPFALIGPKRLGYDAGVSLHGSRMELYLDELKGLTQPVLIIYGDEDTAGPPELIAQYREAAAGMKNVEIDILPGIKHGYMMPWNKEAFDAHARQFSMDKILAILEGLRKSPVRAV